MYRGFKLPALKFESDLYYTIGSALYENEKNVIQDALIEFMYEENSLDGTKIQNNWFPQITADIFISHSHDDLSRAISLAGWLWEKFKLKSFIDSLVWGYSNDLLKKIDDKFCLNSGGQTYNYHSRNYSTSHVHMMLCTALAMMIDRTECLFFLNSPNSICPTVGIQKTISPWIYFEIATTQIIKPKPPLRRLIEGTRVFSKQEKFEKSWQIVQELDLTCLTDLDIKTIKTWGNNKYSSSEEALDGLYRLKSAKNIKTIIE